MRVLHRAVVTTILVSGCRMSISAGEPEPAPAPTTDALPPSPEPAPEIREPPSSEPTPEPEPAPAAEPAPEAKVQGALDRDVIRGVVRAHIPEIRNCYNAGLAKDPELQGRVTLDFVIGGDGKMASSVVYESTLKDPEVAKCIVEASKGWVFPEPAGGANVIVRYPFSLIPG